MTALEKLLAQIADLKRMNATQAELIAKQRVQLGKAGRAIEELKRRLEIAQK